MFDSRRVGGDPQLHYTVHLPALARSVQVPTSSGWQPGALTFWWSWTCLFLYSQPRKICRLNDASVYMDVRFLPDFFGVPRRRTNTNTVSDAVAPSHWSLYISSKINYPPCHGSSRQPTFPSSTQPCNTMHPLVTNLVLSPFWLTILISDATS